ncbi:MAG: DNA-3-methyladenine glycosylase 2 family protein [bacterium]|nr:DNA-3-methyladenine glycosylase 2 family protein [bacterium]
MQLLTQATLVAGTEVLCRQDPVLGAWMARVGPVTLRRHRHRFGALCRTICSQQVAKKAAETVYGRFLAHFAPGRAPDPARLLQLSTETLRACGLTGAKAKYLHALAEAFHEGELGRLRFARLSDQQIIDALIEVPGLGIWSAEMFLIFSVGRADIFSIGDLALRNGVQRVLEREMTHGEIAQVATRWSPFRSIASLYLWKIAHWQP